jgi:hypothetical protein
VTETIVDGLEMIRVQHQERHGFPDAARVRDH